MSWPKRSHPQGLHPQLVATIFEIHIRSVFRHFEAGRLRTVGDSLLADRAHVLELLEARYRSYSATEAKKSLHITNGTLRQWEEWRILDKVEVLTENRVGKASVLAIRSMSSHQIGKKRRLFNTGLDEDSMHRIKSEVRCLTDELCAAIDANAQKNALKRLFAEQQKFLRLERSKRVKLD